MSKESPISKSVSAFFDDAHKAGLIDEITMREFKAIRSKPLKPPSKSKIKKIRKALGVSQAVFASLLNSSVSTVRQWEQGEKVPSGPSTALLNIADKKGLEGLII